MLVMKMTQVTWKEQDYGAVVVPRNIRDGGGICKGNTVVVLGFFRETELISSIIYRKVYHKKLTHATMEAEKSRPKRASCIVPV